MFCTTTPLSTRILFRSNKNSEAKFWQHSSNGMRWRLAWRNFCPSRKWNICSKSVRHLSYTASNVLDSDARFSLWFCCVSRVRGFPLVLVILFQHPRKLVSFRLQEISPVSDEQVKNILQSALNKLEDTGHLFRRSHNSTSQYYVSWPWPFVPIAPCTCSLHKDVTLWTELVISVLFHRRHCVFPWQIVSTNEELKTAIMNLLKRECKKMWRKLKLTQAQAFHGVSDALWGKKTKWAKAEPDSPQRDWRLMANQESSWKAAIICTPLSTYFHFDKYPRLERGPDRLFWHLAILFFSSRFGMSLHARPHRATKASAFLRSVERGCSVLSAGFGKFVWNRQHWTWVLCLRESVMLAPKIDWSTGVLSACLLIFCLKTRAFVDNVASFWKGLVFEKNNP